ncbi:response regulator [Tumidithrix elongata RA019]|uniref:histidine kinase n=1 Tax=Tumidithrix elongata BACA0141 TaxID=2716417 RepID=A0AAW9Q3I0_9CYAN|nr:response regulator [Tumidithrix elongata RA019]
MIKILVIEDEDDIREGILDVLSADNFLAIEAGNGKAGIQMAKHHKPDLILCDVSMPELDGYGVISELRQDPSFATIPFIFLTAQVQKNNLRYGMNLGADDYLTKPISRSELLEAITTRLGKQAAIDQQFRVKLDELRSSITLLLPHELRTPLSGILGLSEALIEEHQTLMPEEVLELAQDIHSCGERLYRLIQNFLMYAELEIAAANQAINLAASSDLTVDAKTIVSKKAVQKAKEKHREADLRLALENASVGLPPAKLQKIIEEIVDNAFKYSEAGTPVFIVSQVVGDSFSVSVSDRGRGMTAEQIANVGAYMQFERKLYEQQGTGLGLAIAKRLTLLYGGELTIHSILGELTEVYITFPLV